MLGPNLGRSPDLEWLMQSGEASKATIIDFLLRETYEPILRLTFALLGEAKTAQQAAVKALAEAVLRVRGYRGDAPLLVWIDEIIVRTANLDHINSEDSPYFPQTSPQDFDPRQIRMIPVTGCSAIDAVNNLEPAYRTPLILRFIHDISTPEIARILHSREEEIETCLETARRTAAVEMQMPSTSAAEDVEDHLAQAFQERWEAAGLLATDHEDLKAQILRLVQEKASNRSKSSAVRQAFLAILGLILMVALVRFQSGKLSVADQQAPKIRTVVVTHIIPVTVTPGPLPTSEQAPAPLTENSDIRQVRQRIIDSSRYWTTLWADALVVDYGPVDYAGPPRTYRNQVWIQKPDQALVLAGPPDRTPEYLRLINHTYAYEADLIQRMTFERELTHASLTNLALPFLQEPGDVKPAARSALYGFYLYDLLQPADAWWPLGALKVVGSEVVAGRQTLIVQWLSWWERVSAQLWVDAHTGMVLRLWLFDTDYPDIVDMEIRLTSISLDPEMPDHFFQIKTNWFERIDWGSFWEPPSEEILPPAIVAPSATQPFNPPGREAASLVPPPAKIDYQSSPLRFQWLSDPGNPLLPSDEADLILDGYWLGRVDIGSPWTVSCERSPNGRYIAFTRGSESAFFASGGLRWIDLSHPDPVHDPLPNGTAGGDFAFSPDSRKLVFSGCTSDGLDCGVFLHDLQTQKNTELIGLEAAGYFTWRPDGKQLALIGRASKELTGGKWELMVYDIPSGDTTYMIKVDPHHPVAPSDSPVREWGGTFPPFKPAWKAARRRLDASVEKA